MRSDFRNNIPFKILVGVLFVFACRFSVAPESETVTSTPTAAQTSTAEQSVLAPTASPTEQVTPTPAASLTVQPSPSPTAQVSSTPTEQPFVLPGGRILFAPYPKDEFTGAWCTSSFHFSWLHLPDMTVEPHPYLTFAYPVADLAITLSPDYAHLAFARETHNEAAELLCVEWTVAMRLGGTADNEVIQAGPTFSQDHILDNRAAGDGISWSADGRFFAFALTHDWSTAAQPRLYLYDVTTGEFKTLSVQPTAGAAFALSPDGTQVAFTELDIDPTISLINSDGSNQRVIVEGWSGRNLVWHPDGQRLFFMFDRPELGIYSVDVLTGVITLIVAADDPTYLGLSPDGSLLTYEDNGLYAVSSNGGVPLRLLRTANSWVWSPDSQYLAYRSGDGIFIIDRLGNGMVEVYRDETMFPGALIGWLP